MKSAVVLVADGTEEIEALTVVDYLRRAGVETRVVSVKREKSVVMSHGVKVEADFDSSLIYDYITLEERLPDALIIPGGMPGSTNIASNRDARELVCLMNDRALLVCAICAAPAVVLAPADALSGKEWTCYPGMEDEKGASCYKHSFKAERVVHSGNLITARGPGVAEEFAMEIVRTLAGDETAEKIKAASVQR